MRIIDADESVLIAIDLQARLMPAIADAESILANAKRLVTAANILAIPVVFTEQNPKGLGHTVPDLIDADATVIHKMTFNARTRLMIRDSIERKKHLIVFGCEAHVCVLQTVLGLREDGRHVFIVSDAVGSRRNENKAVAIKRMESNGADIVTTEMVIFEWLGTAEHPNFKETIALIK